MILNGRHPRVRKALPATCEGMKSVLTAQLDNQISLPSCVCVRLTERFRRLCCFSPQYDEMEKSNCMCGSTCSTGVQQSRAQASVAAVESAVFGKKGLQLFKSVFSYVTTRGLDKKENRILSLRNLENPTSLLVLSPTP